MINIISIVLVVFASSSLVVSCVMTGIITYNSVLERIKEIGVLRAVGARKKDVGRLFKSESLIIGVVSGFVGVIVTYLLSIPINAILNAIFPDYNIGAIANLNILAAIVLVVISGALAFVSGIIPARNAARKDPVAALRSE
jgi:putative ABC transport system permease protein